MYVVDFLIWKVKKKIDTSFNIQIITISARELGTEENNFENLKDSLYFIIFPSVVDR